ncbi:jg11582 [Pararge aegeria aegeria]|uniref:Jg11582 protein n=1 Tax=Pararge aegeria aegeria TaxID=348720 RepID=A0A8S4RTG4_9NEOP|nr:jg11582 [Pararge aegeria aegeria]
MPANGCPSTVGHRSFIKSTKYHNLVPLGSNCSLQLVRCHTSTSWGLTTLRLAERGRHSSKVHRFSELYVPPTATLASGPFDLRRLLWFFYGPPHSSIDHEDTLKA